MPLPSVSIQSKRVRQLAENTSDASCARAMSGSRGSSLTESRRSPATVWIISSTADAARASAFAWSSAAATQLIVIAKRRKPANSSRSIAPSPFSSNSAANCAQCAIVMKPSGGGAGAAPPPSCCCAVVVLIISPHMPATSGCSSSGVSTPSPSVSIS